MAGETRPWGRFYFFHRSAVTAVTVLLFMLSRYFKLGLYFMIKSPHLPAIGSMAFLAIFTQLSLVFIVGFVTGVAFYGGIIVTSGQMALLAGYNRMQPN